MNDILSYNGIKYIKRRIADKIRYALEKFPVIVLTGARQVGKSTMLKNEFTDFVYLTMDDYDILHRALLDPFILLKDKENIIIDEAQKSPNIFNAIKHIIDTNKEKKVIITGSCNLLLMHKITESLAGRALYFEMLPITYGESQGVFNPKNFYNLWDSNFNEKEQTVDEINSIPILLKGFMPPLLRLQRHNDVLLWLEGYVKTYLERDLRELSQVDSLIDFRKVMQILALRTANVLNQADVAKDSGTSQTTTHRYIKLLEISNIIERLPTFFNNRTKRLIKSPKIYYLDTAISIFLSGYYDEESLIKSREIGNYFETMIYLHIKGLCEMLTPKASITYWRTTTGKEVDFIVQHGKKILAFEVKMKEEPSTNDIKNLLLFIEEYPETILGICIHMGNRIKWLHSKIIAVPWWWIDL
ncbi:MAG: ATP-binding protein [Thermodesulfovibrionales bacterium]|nr:ATP-binding protein [Thermodesulfovibrionales bacterium]